MSFEFNRYLFHFDPYIFKQNLIYNGYISTNFAGRQFVRLTTQGSIVYMDAVAFTDILDPAKRKLYYQTYNTSGGKPFDLYNADSTLYATNPTDIWKDPSNSIYAGNESRWENDQRKQWQATVATVCNDERGYKTERFLDPFTQNYLATSDLTITPRGTSAGNALITVSDLQKLLGNTVKGATFCEWSDAVKKSLFLIGSNPFCLYFTWVRPAKYKAMWSSLTISKLALDWPDAEKAKEADSKLNGVEDEATRMAHKEKNDSRSIDIFQTKIIQRQENSTEREYSGYDVFEKGASAVFKVFWPNDYNSTLIEENAQANWLHRVALSFAAPTASPQDRLNNLIFGTKESNTDMLRTENAIHWYLHKYCAAIGDPNALAAIRTTNHRTNPTDSTPIFKRIGVDDTEAATIPKWVSEQKYMWLSFRLRYTFRIKTQNAASASQTTPLNVSVDFDPMSLYRPLAKEVDMDKIVNDSLFPNTYYDTGRTQAAASVTAAPGGTLYQRPSTYEQVTPLFSGGKHSSCGFSASSIDFSKLGSVPFSDKSSKKSTTSAKSGSTKHSDGAQSAKSSGSSKSDKSTGSAKSNKSTGSAKSNKSSSQTSGSDYTSTTSTLDSLFADTGVTAKLITYKVKGSDEKDTSSAEVATLTNVKTLHLSSVYPGLVSTLFDSITFQNVTFFHQNLYFDPSKALGWHLMADLVIDSNCDTLHDVLTSVLKVDKATLSIYVGLGMKAAWADALDVHSFTIEGKFAGLNYNPADISWIHLTSIGARLFGVRTLKRDPSPACVLEYGFSVFGSLNLDVPGSTVPLILQYNISEFEKEVSLYADLSGDIWKDVLGIRGLNLGFLEISTTFALSSPWGSLVFAARAGFLFKYTNITLEGSFKSKDDFSLQATLKNFDLNTICDIYEQVTGSALSLPDIDVTFGSATLSISSSGFSIALDKVVINGYTSINAVISVSRAGVNLRGDLTSSSIDLLDTIQIKKAFMQIGFYSGRKTEVGIGGEITFSGITFDAAVHFYKDGQSAVQWCAFVALSDLLFKQFLPGVTGTCLENVGLTKVVFAVASQDNPYLGNDNVVPTNYQIREGIQVCAMFGTVDAIKDLARHDVDGIVLNARWDSKNKQFSFGLTIPTDIKIGFNTGITTTPINIEILTNPVQLQISGGLKVPVPKQDPLYFNFYLTAKVEGASFTATMDGYWNNPFGISSQVKVGNVVVGIDINYAQFFSSGTPEGFTVGGSLGIGNTTASMVLKFDEDPSNELLSASVSNLSVADLVSFARTLTQCDIPHIENVINITFKNLSIYICTGGVWIGNKWYPPGFAFSADLIVWDNDVNMMCSVSSSQIKIHGGTEMFHVGVLWIHGRDGRAEATFDCTVGTSSASFDIDGAVTCWVWVPFEGWCSYDISVQVHVGLYPSLSFSGNIAVGFSASAPNLMVMLSASPSGALPPGDFPSDTDFILAGSFEEEVLSHLHRELLRHFELAHQISLHGTDQILRDLNEEEQIRTQAVADAQAALKMASDDWDTMRTHVTAECGATIESYEVSLTRSEEHVSSARSDFNGAMEMARVAVQSANHLRVAKLIDLEHNVALASQTQTRKTRFARRSLDETINDMYSEYGNSRNTLRRVERRLDEAQTRTQALIAERNELQDSTIYDVWEGLRIPMLENEIAVSRADETNAEAIVADARSARATDGYQRRKEAILASRIDLENIQANGAQALAAAQDALAAADIQTSQVLEDAKALFDSTRTGPQYDELQSTLHNLEQFKIENEPAYKEAQQSIADLLDSPLHQAYISAKEEVRERMGDVQQVQASRSLLSFFSDMYSQELERAQWVLDRQDSAFRVTKVNVSGSLQGFLGAEGTHPQALNAELEVEIGGCSRAISTQWHTATAETFVIDVFKYLWPYIRAD